MNKKLKAITALGLSTIFFLVNIPQSDALESISEIKGKDRYETAGKIADMQSYSTAILVNSDNSLADGLSASSLAGAANAPILLTKKSTIPNSTAKRLNGVKKVYLVGGENSIDKLVEKELNNQHIVVVRISGTDRLSTSYNVANEVGKIKKIDKVILTNGFKGEADAMSIASVSVRDIAPIILTDGKSVTYNTDGKETFAIGGSSSISDSLVNKVKATRIGGLDRFDTNKKIIEKFYSGTDKFYISKAYNLVDALSGSTVAKIKPIVLVAQGSDKSILKYASEVTALGGVDSVTIDECINITNGNGEVGNGKVISLAEATEMAKIFFATDVVKDDYVNGLFDPYIIKESITIKDQGKEYYAFTGIDEGNDVLGQKYLCINKSDKSEMCAYQYAFTGNGYELIRYDMNSFDEALEFLYNQNPNLKEVQYKVFENFDQDYTNYSINAYNMVNGVKENYGWFFVPIWK